ncbi:hypothetical protein OG292_20295 [Streptomyces sp. NBC_01511]|uniref:hypothetical protein n=1 Tax=Streptomyces sp. NBC_01511 TaxID=2903889 RepID=UPI003864CED1
MGVGEIPGEIRLPMPVALRPWIERISVAVYAAAEGRPLIHPPDPATEVLWRTTGDSRGTGGGGGGVVVLGPRTRASYYEGKDVPLCVRLRLPTGSATDLLGVPAGELVDRVLPLEELWGRPRADRLADEPASLGPGPAVTAEHFAAALLAPRTSRASRVSPARPTYRAHQRLARAAAVQLAAPTGPERSVRVAEVARRIGVSERDPRNVFTAAVGLTPTHPPIPRSSDPRSLRIR